MEYSLVKRRIFPLETAVFLSFVSGVIFVLVSYLLRTYGAGFAVEDKGEHRLKAGVDYESHNETIHLIGDVLQFVVAVRRLRPGKKEGEWKCYLMDGPLPKVFTPVDLYHGGRMYLAIQPAAEKDEAAVG